MNDDSHVDIQHHFLFAGSSSAVLFGCPFERLGETTSSLQGQVLRCYSVALLRGWENAVVGRCQWAFNQKASSVILLLVASNAGKSPFIQVETIATLA